MTNVAGSSHWNGSFFDGTGTMSTDTSDTIHDAAYSFASRFHGAPVSELRCAGMVYDVNAGLVETVVLPD